MNELERMVSDGARRLFRQECGEPDMEQLEEGRLPSRLWALFAESGFAQLLSSADGDPAEAMGAALQLVHLSGYYRVPLPVRESLTASALLRGAGIEQPGGVVIAMHAQAQSVPWARHANHLVIIDGAPGRERIRLVEAAGVEVTPGRNIAAEPRDVVAVGEAVAHATAALPNAGELLRTYNAQMTAAALTGAAEAALDLGVQYAKDRIQFDQPLARFQAVQQSLAIVAGEVASARAACALAFRSVAPSPRLAAVAKIRAGVAAGIAANAVHQVHGAIGVTQEYALHYLTRRLWAWRAEDGTEAQWAGEIGRAAIARGADHLWSDITEAGLGRAVGKTE